MLSGIGNKKILSHFGINTVIHNPSVGQNMSDHVLLPNSYNVNSTGTVNSYPHGEGFISAVAEWEQSSTGPMTYVIVLSVPSLPHKSHPNRVAWASVLMWNSYASTSPTRFLQATLIRPPVLPVATGRSSLWFVGVSPLLS
jgi:choline dehydrogenase-like flavoprotein